LFAFIAFFVGYFVSYLIDVLVLPFIEFIEKRGKRRKESKLESADIFGSDSILPSNVDSQENCAKKIGSCSHESDDVQFCRNKSGNVIEKSTCSTECAGFEIEKKIDDAKTIPKEEDKTKTIKYKIGRGLKHGWFFLLSVFTLKPSMIDDPPNEDGLVAFNAECKTYLQLGFGTALALFLHNLPEGVATYAGFVSDPSLGIGLAIAIAFHNIPEGATVAIPVYLGTGSKKKAFAIASASGLAETLSSILAYLIIPTGEVDVFWFGLLYCFLAGLMTRVAARSLLITAIKFDPEGVYTTPSFFFGMMVMALSLLAFQFVYGNPESETAATAEVSTALDIVGSDTIEEKLIDQCGLLERPILSARGHMYHKQRKHIMMCPLE